MTIDTSREAVERLLEGVTPGPWAASEHQWPDQVGCCPLVGRPFSAHKNMRNVAAANTKADIHFIAAARELVPALLARAEAAEAECVKMLNEQDRDYNRKTNDLIERHADQITFLLAERDAALAEVARLTTPPDDAEVEAAHREWFSTTYPHTYANMQCVHEARDAFSFSEEAWAAATRAAHAARRKE